MSEPVPSDHSAADRLPSPEVFRSGIAQTFLDDAFVFAIEEGLAKENISLRQLALKIGVSVSSLSRILSKQRRPHLDTFGLIIDWLGIPADQFFVQVSQLRTDAPSFPPSFEDSERVWFCPLDGAIYATPLCSRGGVHQKVTVSTVTSISEGWDA